MKTSFKYFSFLASLVLVMLMVTGVVDAATMFPFLGVSSTVTFAAIAGAVTTDNMKIANSDVLDDPYEKMMTIMRPDDYPLDQLIRNTKKAHSWDSWKVTHPNIETRPFTDTVNGASTATDDDDSALASITVTNAGQWIVDDIIRFRGIVGANGLEITGQVTAKAGSVLSVMAINGQGADENTIPIIPDTTVISRVGNAKDEIAAQNGVYNAVPDTGYNNMQIHMGQIEESILYAKHAKNIKYDKALQKLLAMYNFRNEAEATALFGQRRVKIDPTSSKTKYFTGGAEFFIENSITYGTSENTDAFREKDWTSITKNVFTGNSGSSRRIMFAGKDLIESISNIDTISKQMLATESSEIIWGVNFTKVKTRFGELLIKYHKMFDIFGWEKNGMIIDPAHVDKYTWEQFQKTTIDKDKQGDSRVNTERFHEISCHVFKYLDTHFKITPHA